MEDTATNRVTISYSEAARRLETDRKAIATAVRILKIDPKPVPSNGQGKGLDSADIARIRRALTDDRVMAG